jgi:hypothetical protein
LPSDGKKAFVEASPLLQPEPAVETSLSQAQ